MCIRDRAKAIHRIKFEELFFIQLRIMKLKFKQNKTIRGFVFEKIDKHFNTFYQEKMPFELTNAQKRVLREIRRDTLSGKPVSYTHLDVYKRQTFFYWQKHLGAVCRWGLLWRIKK